MVMKSGVPFIIILKNGVGVEMKGEIINSFMDEVVGYYETTDSLVIRYWNGAKLETRKIDKNKIKKASVITNEEIFNIIDNSAFLDGGKNYKSVDELDKVED